MAFQKPKINKISTNIKDVTIYLRSVKKFGKSTLFRDMILAKYKNPEKGLLVSVGMEKGDTLLDNVNSTHIDTYKELIELKTWLIKERGNDHDIEIVGFDTADELMPIFEKEVVRLYNVENPKKQVKSVKAAFGGYNAGVEMAAQMVKEYMDELKKAGFGVVVIAHTKMKQIKEKGNLEEEGYMQLTSNLISAYESAFGDIFDITLTGIIDRDIEEKGDGDHVKRYATDSIRKLYFRGTNLIDAGGRFAAGAVPEYMVFDKPNMGEEFVRVIEEGMMKSKTTEGVYEESKKELISRDKEDDQEIEENEGTEDNIVTDDIDDDELEEDLIDTIRVMFKDCKNVDKKNSVKEIIAEYGKLNDVDEDGLRRIYDILK